jgi:hypothetical protein
LLKTLLIEFFITPTDNWYKCLSEIAFEKKMKDNLE